MMANVNPGLFSKKKSFLNLMVMNSESEYKEVNRQSWNDRVDAHLESDFYDLEGFRRGNTSLTEIELDLLGEVSGKYILHLQCHFGQDTLSLQRMGANCTGIDLSDKAIGAAKKLNEELGLNARFIACDVYDSPNHINEKFDIVFTSYGTIGWLPDLDRWASVISHFLKPGGMLVFVEFHPVVWMYDDDFTEVKYSYLKSDPILDEEEGTYADREAEIKIRNISWNHGLSEVITALLKQGLKIESFKEYDYSPYNCFNGTVEFEPGKFRIEKLEDKIPMVYSVVAKVSK
jgi:2-polyprenyl-3-methyl-5-hydroxy-6-metoxy-1,4-benzoquinol methylase